MSNGLTAVRKCATVFDRLSVDPVVSAAVTASTEQPATSNRGPLFQGRPVGGQKPPATAGGGGGGAEPPTAPPKLPLEWFSPDPPWRIPPERVPAGYPKIINGGRVHFTPSERPNPVDNAVHILYGDERGGNHLHEFGGCTPSQVLAMIDETLSVPYSIERAGSHYVFRRIVDRVPVEALVAARKPIPTLRTAYAAWDQANAIRAGRRYQSLRWGPWPE